MKLKAILKSIDEVDEGFRSLYTKVGDEFVLDVDDGAYKAKISQFRDNNIDLAKKLEAAGATAAQVQELTEKLGAFKGIDDPDAAREALKQLQDLEDDKLISAGKLDEVLAQRTERMKADFDGQIDALTKDRDTYQTSASNYKAQLSEVVIDNGLQRAVTGVASVRSGAMRDILSRGRDTWALDESGSPVPTGPDKKTMFGKDGKSPLSMEEWAQDLVQTAPYLFEGSAGGGAQGSSGRGNGSEKTIVYGDQDAMNANIERIASGEVSIAE